MGKENLTWEMRTKSEPFPPSHYVYRGIKRKLLNHPANATVDLGNITYVL